MVGQPKHLHDLNRIEADVRVTCRECGFEVDWTVADLSAHLHAIGGNPAWSEVTRLLVCRRQGCRSTRLRASVVPFARRQPNLPRRIGKADEHIVATVLEVLDRAVQDRSGRSAATSEVRLALLVVYLYTRDRAVVRGFWDRAGRAGASVSDTLLEQYHRIEHHLREHGVLAPAPVVERTPTWPWACPAPPGWLLGESGVRDLGRDEQDGPDGLK